MSDIIERLRWTAVHGDQEQAIAVMERAAAEIERLQRAIREYACTGTDHPCGCYDEFVRDTAEIERLKADMREIASQCHNIPRSATADRIDQIARRALEGK